MVELTEKEQKLYILDMMDTFNIDDWNEGCEFVTGINGRNYREYKDNPPEEYNTEDSNAVEA
jgi:hypothetical protein